MTPIEAHGIVSAAERDVDGTGIGWVPTSVVRQIIDGLQPITREIYTVIQIPYTFAAKNTVGNKRTTFEVEADSAPAAIKAAQARSNYPRHHDDFYWEVTGSRLVH